MKELEISIDRGASKWAIFESFNCIEGFHPYTDEKQALEAAKKRCAELGCFEPEIVYPKITSIRVSIKLRKARSKLYP